VDVDDLYGLPLDRFVPERAALTKELRAAGQREEAAAVASLRKPSIAAWAVNQLVRSQGRAITSLFEAGQALRNAQAKVLAGRGGGPALRTAAERERNAVDALVKAARGLLCSDGHELSAAIIERVRDTLHAAALDDDAQQLIRGGRLERELRHVGFGIEDAAAAPARRATPARRRATAGGASRARRTANGARGTANGARESGDDRERAARERAESRRVERDRANARKTARALEADARRRVTRAARALALAEERRERAERAMHDADEALTSARLEADAAAAAHRSAQEQLDRV
jgi:hypothetical protein